VAVETSSLARSDVTAYLRSLGTALPAVERFWALGDRTALRTDATGAFYQANYERGLLLYALIAKYRPVSVLEFGTGRGYGCLCMAWAMVDHGIPGRIFTIDMLRGDEPFEWPIDRGDGPKVETLARDVVWRDLGVPDWLDRIETLTGWSGQIMGSWPGPSIDFAYIDAGHGFGSVRHDFYCCLDVRANRLGVLFDDYGSPDPGFGVQRLIDQEVAPCFDADLIHTDRCWPRGDAVGRPRPEYGMVWIHTDGARAPIDQLYPREGRSAFLKKYRRHERVKAVRRRVGKILRGR